MKILFVCAGGMSTGLIVKKMEKWASENGKDLVVKATGVGGYESKWQDYDCILVGPQVRFKIPEMKEKVKIGLWITECRQHVEACVLVSGEFK